MSTEQENYKNGLLKKIITADGELKEILVNYVGRKLNPENDIVTIEMILEMMASEFPELLISFAEENFMKGYDQGLVDVLSAPTIPVQKNK